MRLVSMSVARPVLVTMLMLALGGIGLFCYTQLPRELFPEIEFPVVTVVTRYEGAGPEEVEQLIVKELEDEISTVEGIKHLRSISQQGMGLLIAEFYLETDVDVAAADVRAKVNLVRPLLPESADDPIVQKFDFSAQPVMQLAVSARRSLREVFRTADRRIKDRIATVPGVASVTILGGEEREIHVLTDQQRLRAHGLSITDVAASVAAANLETPGGQIQQNSREYTVRLRGKFTSLEELRNLRLTLPSGRPIYLRDVAEVRDAFKDIRDKVRADGKTCVGMSVQKRSDGNTVSIDADVREQIAVLGKTLPADYAITVQEESASWITSSIGNVFSNMRVGIVLTAITLFLFLHSLRSVAIVSLTMPISVVATFTIMYLSGLTMNLMSMMGMAMIIGILVDNSVLVLENVVRHLHMGQGPKEAAVTGTSEIAIAVASTTMTNIVIFVPIAFMGGVIGQFFKDLGLTATFATVVSLLVSFTLAPMLASRLLTKQNTEPMGTGLLGKFGRWFDGGFEGVRGTYLGALRWCLRHRIWSLVIVAGLFFSSLQLGQFIGGEFITSMDQGKFIVTIEMPTGTRLEETDAAVARLEGVLRDEAVLPELVSTYATIGQVMGSGVGGSSQSVNIAQINVTLVDKLDREESTEEVMDRLRPVLAGAGVPGAHIKLLESGGGGEGEVPIQLEITGDRIERVRAFMEEAVAVISDPERVPGAVDVDTNYRSGQPEVRIIPDREKCQDADLDVRYLASVVNASFDGLIVSEYRDGAYDYDIRVRNAEESRGTVEDVRELTVMNRQGKLIPLPQVAQVVTTTGPSQLFRKDRQSMITVTADVSGRAQGDVAKTIEEQMVPLLAKYPDCGIFFAGEVEQMRESFGRLGVAMVMSLCLTYMLLAALLESFVEPFMIMAALPLSLIGVLVALFLTAGTFSIFSIMSMVILIGLVINNAIIVLNYVNILRAKGKERNEAIVEAGSIRLRPMVMTNLTTIVALIPLALGLGWGGEMMSPMAMVQIGGLIAGGWIGLLIVPVIYTLYDDFSGWVGRLVHRRRQKAITA